MFVGDGVKAQHIGFTWDGNKFITNYNAMPGYYATYYYPGDVTPISYEQYSQEDNFEGSGRQVRFLFQDNGVMIFQKKWRYESKWVNISTTRAGNKEEIAKFNEKKRAKNKKADSGKAILPTIIIVSIILIIIYRASTKEERENKRNDAALQKYMDYKDKHSKLKQWGKLGRCKMDFIEEINTWHQYSRIKKNWDNIDEYAESQRYNDRLADERKSRELRAKQEEEHKRQEEIDKHERARVAATTAGKLIKKAVGHIYSDSSPGVYLIVNNKTLDFYIGESQNMSFRRKTHLGEMAAREHHRPLMQEHFNQYGVDSFDFYILKRTNGMSDETRKEIESIYIYEYNPTYN